MAPDLVLDTNVALDLLVFRDPASRSLYEALRERRAIWLSCRACRDEFLRVIEYPSVTAFLARRAVCTAKRREEALGEFDRLSATVERTAHTPMQDAPRCRDIDDQFLVDFAVATGADFLISKDKHLTDLAGWFARNDRRPRILTPEDFLASGNLPRN